MIRLPHPTGRAAVSLLTVVAAILFAGSSSAAAADFYVDDDTGSNGNACTAPSAPCATIAGGLNRAGASTGSGDTVRVDGGSYIESVDVGDGNSLRELDFNGDDGDTEARIKGPSGWPAVRVLPGQPAGRIEGFTLRSQGNFAVEIADGATLTGNEFDLVADGSPGVLVSAISTVSDNAFFATPGGVSVGIEITGGGPSISGNRLHGLTVAIRLAAGSGATASITGNEIAGLTRESDFARGIDLGPTTYATIVANVIRDGDPASYTVGVNAQDDGFSPLGTNAQLMRNRITGQDLGLRLLDTAPTTLSSDLITGNEEGGLVAASTGIGTGDVDARNVTVTGNGTDIALVGGDLTLDSSIVGDPILGESGAGCTITHSAGPTITPGGNGCAAFQTTADPGFVSPGTGDYHLAETSPLTDAGQSGPESSEDVDGDPRVVDGDRDGTAVRDIGADEFVPDTTPPVTVIESGPAAITADQTPTFTFSAGEPGVNFRCRLDSEPFVACVSPHTAAALADGPHRFEVEATDPAGNTEPVPAAWTFTLDTSPPGNPPTGDPSPDPPPAEPPAADTAAPKTRITGRPHRKTRKRTARFRFRSSERGSTFTCRLDRGRWRRCRSPKRYRHLKPGRHIFRVRATDRAGNTDRTPARRRWRVRR